MGLDLYLGRLFPTCDCHVLIFTVMTWRYFWFSEPALGGPGGAEPNQR
jgi:hypothetical protein